jgi:hypothetical protein
VSAPHDDGRTAAYAAEDAAFGGTEFDVDAALDELQAVAARLVAGAWWRSCGAPSTRVVAARAGTRSSSARAAGGAVEVRLAADQLTPATLAHELAHALAGVGHGHDATFRAAHVDVVAMLAGGALGADLAAAYAGVGVPVGDRRWPSPVRVTGSGFAVVP